VFAATSLSSFSFAPRPQRRALARCSLRCASVKCARDFHILRLGARIWDLRQGGHEIEERKVEGKSYSEYRLGSARKIELPPAFAPTQPKQANQSLFNERKTLPPPSLPLHSSLPTNGHFASTTRFAGVIATQVGVVAGIAERRTSLQEVLLLITCIRPCGAR
jgi:hypothetical protein